MLVIEHKTSAPSDKNQKEKTQSQEVISEHVKYEIKLQINNPTI